MNKLKLYEVVRISMILITTAPVEGDPCLSPQSVGRNEVGRYGQQFGVVGFGVGIGFDDAK